MIGARLFGNTEAKIEWLLTDSRSLAFPETSLFFALQTRTGDGHRYISDLYNRGVRNFVVRTLPDDYEHLPEANFLQVESPINALQQLAMQHRRAFDVPVIGITGSNGKTSVKEWIYQMLTPSRSVTRSPRSYNSQIGVPLSVWLLSEESRVGIFEAGISRPGEMKPLERIIKPTVGVMTNIGGAHQENFGSLAEKCAEKLTLFADTEALIYCADEPIICQCLDDMGYNGQRIGWSEQGNPAAIQIHTTVGEHNTTIKYTIPEGNVTTAEGTIVEAHEAEITVPFTAGSSRQNVIHTLAVGLYLGLSPQVLAERLAALSPVAMRMEVKEGVRGLTLINDSYNSDVASLDIALDFLQRRCKARRSILILSDMLETGLDADVLYAKVAEMIRQRNVDMLVGVGTEIPRLGSHPDAHFFETTDLLLKSGLLDTFGANDVVLLKGARTFAFERLDEYLTLKVHETTLEVNLLALSDNLRHYRSMLQPGTRITCMVKASAYGAGSYEVARTLQDLGVDYLAVAVADEGAALRKAGITCGIIVMNPEMSSFGTLFRYRLEPEVYNFRLLDALIATARREGITNFPVHIKLDTGMCRLGFDPRTDIPLIADRLLHQQALIPRSVFSHFAGSDSPDFNDFSDRQFEIFDEASRRLQLHFPHRILRHICNTAGIARFPERHLDMVRLGLGLYGVDPITGEALSPVSTLRTTILQIREVPAGTSVGYSRRTIVDRPSRIAAIPIGYADGLDRRLGNRTGFCLVGGKPAPYVGNICMDVCMVDVTDIPCVEGDSVEIFGAALPVTKLSDLLGTIPYEMLTAVSERVRRVYVR